MVSTGRAKLLLSHRFAGRLTLPIHKGLFRLHPERTIVAVLAVSGLEKYSIRNNEIRVIDNDIAEEIQTRL